MVEFKITRYSHYFSVAAITAKARGFRRSIAETLIESNLTKKRGRFVQEQKRIYARRDLEREEICFHDNLWEEFYQKAMYEGFNEDSFEIDVVPMYEPVKFEMSIDATPWPEQLPVIDFCLAEGKQKVVTAQPGFGKAQSLDASIKIPGGWKRMGDISIGDRVISRDGTECNVTGVFPQGVTELWRVHFADGRFTDVNPDHLWEIRMRSNEGSQVIDTREIKRRLDLNNDRSKRITVPLCVAEEGVAKDFLIDPYVLGVALGDGNITERGVSISKPDKFIRERISGLLPEDLRVSEIKSTEGMTFSIVRSSTSGPNNSIVSAFNQLGLAGKRSWEKFIPEEYLHGSAEQRRELLRGLMDTDGTVDGKTTATFSSTSYELAKGVQYLVRSLGGIASLSSRIPKFTYRGEVKEGRKDYRLIIRTKTPTDLFALPRKLNQACGENQYREHLRLGITAIEVLPDAPTQCIMVDHPEHLYVTDDFIVTHNTMISLYVAAQMGVRFAVVTLGGYEDRWVPEMYRLLGFEPSEVRSCCGCTKLYKLLREVKETGIPDVKAIFLSTATLRDFFKNYKNGKVVGTGCEDIDPRDIWEVLGVGLRITDEAHKDFHANFIADLFSHVPRTIYLTATLFSNQDFMKRMYEILLPRKFRKEGGKLNVYVETVRVLYRLKDPSKVRFNGGQGSYSHTAYEAWIMKDAEREKNYIEAIYKYALNQWVLSKLDGHKLLIFAATIELCQKVRDLLQQRLPDLIINSYTAGDDYQILLDSDIIVSTIGKSGTAVDIPDLTQAIMTVAIDSPNANVQALGRLRELKGDKKFPQIFHYFVCMDIQKQIDYAKSKERLFSNRVTKVRTEHLPGVI
ncbi:hypothetical protein HAYMO_291 [Serratia phage vB_SmaM_Haymo]|nr:hypothetical protein HAYMO_291 [Serratia phage vB_SmaM_Haymo]